MYHEDECFLGRFASWKAGICRFWSLKLKQIAQSTGRRGCLLNSLLLLAHLSFSLLTCPCRRRSKRTLAGDQAQEQGGAGEEARWEARGTTGALAAHREVGPAVSCPVLSTCWWSGPVWLLLTVRLLRQVQSSQYCSPLGTFMGMHLRVEGLLLCCELA